MFCRGLERSELIPLRQILAHCSEQLLHLKWCLAQSLGHPHPLLSKLFAGLFRDPVAEDEEAWGSVGGGRGKAGRDLTHFTREVTPFC